MAGLGWQELGIVVAIVGTIAVPMFGLVSVVRYRSRTRNQRNTHVSPPSVRNQTPDLADVDHSGPPSEARAERLAGAGPGTVDAERLRSPGTIQGYRYAGIWHRIGGEVLDNLILLIPRWVIAAVAAQLFVANTSRFAEEIMLWLVWLAYYVVGNGRGGTFGKRLAKLRVVDAAGAVPGIRRAAMRAVLPYGLRLLLIVLIPQLNEADPSGAFLRMEPPLFTWGILLWMVLVYLELLAELLGVRYPSAVVLPMGAFLFTGGILLLIAVDYLWMIRDPRKQTLHDKLAGTFVVGTGVRFAT